MFQKKKKKNYYDIIICIYGNEVNTYYYNILICIYENEVCIYTHIILYVFFINIYIHIYDPWPAQGKDAPRGTFLCSLVNI